MSSSPSGRPQSAFDPSRKVWSMSVAPAFGPGKNPGHERMNPGDEGRQTTTTGLANSLVEKFWDHQRQQHWQAEQSLQMRLRIAGTSESRDGAQPTTGSPSGPSSPLSQPRVRPASAMHGGDRTAAVSLSLEPTDIACSSPASMYVPMATAAFNRARPPSRASSNNNSSSKAVDYREVQLTTPVMRQKMKDLNQRSSVYFGSYNPYVVYPEKEGQQHVGRRPEDAAES